MRKIYLSIVYIELCIKSYTTEANINIINFHKGVDDVRFNGDISVMKYKVDADKCTALSLNEVIAATIEKFANGAESIVYLDGEKVDTGKTLKKHLSDNGYINVNYCDYYTPTDTIREFFGYRKQFESPSNAVIIPD